MSEARPTRMPLIALTFAVVAVAVALVAAFVVLTRDDAHKQSAGSPTVPMLIDQRVAASEVIKLRDNIEIVVEAGLPRGVRVKNAELARTLGLQDDDVITSVSGRQTTREIDVTEVVMRAGTMRATTLYVELERGRARALVRWQLDGSLLDARRDAMAASAGSGSGMAALGSLSSGGLKNPFADPLDSIEKIDDTHYRVPRATFHALLADPTSFSNGARVVPSVKNGVTEGFKLYAIRPGSAYGRLGFMNGDMIGAINGEELADVDDLVAFFVNLKKASIFRVDIARRGQPLTFEYQITK